MLKFSWENGNGSGPWGAPKKPKAGTGSSSAGQKRRQPEEFAEPDVEQLMAEFQRQFRKFTGGNGGGKRGGSGLPGGQLIGLIGAVIVIVWLLSGFYIVDPDEEGVVLRFGEYVNTTSPGLNYKLPAPIETVLKPKVTRENIVEIGFRSAGNANSQISDLVRRSNNRGMVDVPAESLMLTGDENIVDLTFTVRWRISDARAFLFNIADPVNTIKNVSESAMREIIGGRPIDDALTENKSAIQAEARELIQSILNDYQAGIVVSQIELQQVNPPSAVIDAFRDVQAARADAEREQNQATGYANDILPRARGEAAQITQNAEAYKAARVAQAEGEASRFISQQRAYAKAKDVTERRMYLETMEKVLQDARKVIMSSENGNNVLPYMNVNELQRRGPTPRNGGAQ